MDGLSQRSQIVLALLGGLLAATGAVAFGLMGVPEPIANVAGLALAMPLFALSLNSASFNTSAYLSDVSRLRVLLDGALLAVGSFASGAVVVAIGAFVGTGTSLLVALGTAATFISGVGGFRIYLSDYLRR